jgi:homopolymeric O-antigen transport system ATP-binding protein
VRMRSVRVVDATGEVVSAIDVRQPVGIEIAFRVMKPDGVPLFPKFKLYDARRNVLFNAIDTSDRWLTAPAAGEYVSTGWIPGNLLNEGLVSVDAGIWSLGAPKLYGHAGAEAVTFHVQDPGEGDSAKGMFTGQLQGVMRPLLEWTTEES